MDKQYYVYKISFSDLSYYIGYRGSCQDASADFLIKYFSSSKVVKQKITESSFSGELLHTGLDQKTAYEMEQSLIHIHINDPMCLNKVCYFGRTGFGIMSDETKANISKEVTARWQNSEYKARVAETHRRRWAESDLREKQIARLTGVKRPEHSAKLMGHPGCTTCKGVKKHEGFGALISAALSGKSKSDAHKEKLRVPKPKVVSRIIDRREMGLGNFMNWCGQQDKLLLAQKKRI